MKMVFFSNYLRFPLSLLGNGALVCVAIGRARPPGQGPAAAGSCAAEVSSCFYTGQSVRPVVFHVLSPGFFCVHW